MKKTTVYLPNDLEAALERMATAQGRSEAVRRLTQDAEGPRPRLPLFRGKDPTLARRVDEELKKGFGR